MKIRVIWTEHARADLYDACEYLAGVNLDAALELLQREVELATDRLAKAPNRGRWVPELKDTMAARVFREIIVRQFRVIYAPAAGAVVIHGVFDSRRDLEELLLSRHLR